MISMLALLVGHAFWQSLLCPQKLSVHWFACLALQTLGLVSLSDACLACVWWTVTAWDDCRSCCRALNDRTSLCKICFFYLGAAASSDCSNSCQNSCQAGQPGLLVAGNKIM